MTDITVTNTASPTDDLVELTLRLLDVARLRTALAFNEIEVTATSLKGSLISVEAALQHLHTIGVPLIELSSEAEAAYYRLAGDIVRTIDLP
jgi:hypothetical protein